MYAKILVPVDGSPTSNQALDEAIRLAKALGSNIEVVHVVDNSYILYDTGYQPPAGLHTDFISAGQGILDDAKKRVEAAGLPGNTRLIESPVAAGDISGTILQAAKESSAELVVIGSHGQKGFRKMVLGSVAEKVMHQCPLPVWIIRGTQAAA
ncbi:universal stress protein UspA [Herbaspirillum sp. meg3]|uniref:universal stress protein n=1 Tax=Herbaspirillum sp. meg3 TaxID=2025949 RepID=UPI000B97EA59|nr:universal stress protein [Herbaspirillum sp. meg3]ASU38747.1 universal stress protein UspA [Herbaspirillum sp. meg3]